MIRIDGRLWPQVAISYHFAEQHFRMPNGETMRAPVSWGCAQIRMSTSDE
ncbi:hypothetical protein [Solimonas marina]|uniref:Uncharacterized protein n=1 Tax=Solimonas marina TaxID=2714601 RepID=A0A969WAV0_9GAMM|nr:hypothetical protein [Solimonas marina]NKF23577.1 hypothetical protein [Solimonas marina]